MKEFADKTAVITGGASGIGFALAHCETQNRLRQVFDDVNNSLKKAASLAKAIGAKFGIKARDIERMTSEHTEGAVEQFLNQLF